MIGANSLLIVILAFKFLMKKGITNKVSSSISKTKRPKEELEKERLIVSEITDLKSIKLPGDVNRDVKKLTKFL